MEMNYCIFLLLASCTCDKIMLKQVSEKQDLSAWSADARDCNPGWVSENFQTRQWVTCASTTKTKKENKCDLFSDYWKLDKANVNVVFVNLFGSGVNCSYQKYRCSDTLTFKVYVGSVGGATSKDMYKEVSLVPRKPIPGSNPQFYEYNETFPVSVNSKSALKLNLQTSFFCGQVKGAKVYYHVCPSRSKELVRFAPQNGPRIEDSPSKILGKCVANSVQVSDELYMSCSYDGKSTVHGKCICNKGFEIQGESCKECGGQKFKPSVGNEKCKLCGRNTESKGRVACICLPNSFRVKGREKDNEADCHRPPKRPKSPTIRNKTENSAIIDFTLLTKDEIGDGSVGDYVLNCTKNCPRSVKIKRMGPNSFNVTGLGSLVTVYFILYMSNNVTDLTGKRNEREFNFTTLAGGVPGKIRNFKVIRNSDGSVTLTWNAPEIRGGKKLEYVVQYDDGTRRTKETKMKVESGSSTIEYTFRIHVEYKIGEKVIRGEVFQSDPVKIRGGIALITTIIIIVVVVVVVVFLAVTSLCIYRRKNPPLRERREDGTVIQRSRFLPNSKIYVDPTLYKDVDDAVEQFANELDRNQLSFGKTIGGGEFADVYTGTLLKTSGKLTNVAVKRLKPGAGKKDRDDFLSEAAILGQFSDPNVIAIEGVVMKDHPHLIILEYMANGSLDAYLQKNDMQFQVEELLGMSRCVASGMAYLSEMGFIHRDLAARNILVDEHNICKITDFGMSREIKLDDTYETQGGKIPVRWTAPEAIQFKKFTSASDVWSYGILLWEIMSYGERPYWDWNNYTVLERLNDGYRLPPPMHCRKVIHNLMLDCWNKDRAKRPKFKEIKEKIEQWIRSPELLSEYASVVTKTDENLDYTVLETVQKWLLAVNMEQYTDVFLENGYTTPKQLLDLTDNDLIKIGISLIGHRKKVLKAIKNTRDQTRYVTTTTIA